MPQGSILGGFFFIVFQNDFPASSELGEAILFVDDDTENVSDGDHDGLVDKVKELAKSSTQWVRDNRMVCAGEKTKLLIVATRETRERNGAPLVQFCLLYTSPSPRD